jgi:hypothetical protein
LPPETKNGDRRSIYKETVKIVVRIKNLYDILVRIRKIELWLGYQSS